MSFPEQNNLHVQEYNDTVYIYFVLQIQSYIIIHVSYTLNVALLIFIMLLSHPENIYRLFVRCGIAYTRLMVLFAAIRF